MSATSYLRPEKQYRSAGGFSEYRTLPRWGDAIPILGILLHAGDICLSCLDGG